MGIEFERQINKALALNERCREAGFKKSCFAVFMTALTGDERYGFDWAVDIEESNGKPPLLDTTLAEAGLRRVANMAPGENIPFKVFTKILERPRELIREAEHETPELAGREAIGRVILYTLREGEKLLQREDYEGKERRIGHASLIVDPNKLTNRIRSQLEKKNQYCLIDSALEDGYVVATPKEIREGMLRTDPRFTSELSILVRK